MCAYITLWDLFFKNYRTFYCSVFFVIKKHYIVYMEIKNNEVMLGNYVTYEDKVIKIGPNDFTIIPSRNQKYGGISISEVWLDKLGFIQTKTKNHWFIEVESEDMLTTQFVRFNEEKKTVVLLKVIGTNNEPNFMEYGELNSVHRLQNYLNTNHNIIT